MYYETGLLQTLGNLKSFNSIDFNNLDTYSYKGFRTKEDYSLYKFSYVDIDCHHKSPLGVIRENELQNVIERDNKTLLFKNIIFCAREKIETHYCEDLDLEFVNCIFLCPFRLESVPKSILFDNCYFRNLSISTRFPNVEIISSVFEELLINGYNNELSICTSEIGFLSIFDCDDKSVLSLGCTNEIHHFRYSNSPSLTNFDYKQFTCFSKNLYFFDHKITKLINYKKTKFNRQTLLDTLNLIENLDFIKEDPKLCTDIDYLKTKLLKRNFLQSIILNFCGYFMRPGQIVIEIFLTLLLFATGIYLIKNDNNTFLHCLEQSFNSFFCSNSEDMSFWEKVLCYSETVLGFLEMNIFTIALAKKYLK